MATGQTTLIRWVGYEVVVGYILFHGIMRGMMDSYIWNHIRASRWAIKKWCTCVLASRRPSVLVVCFWGRQNTLYGFSPGEMFPVSPWRGSDSTCTVATDTQFTGVAAKSSSVLEYGELLQHSPCRAKPTPMRSNLRIELCLWIYTIHPLLQCQSSSGSVGKSIWLAFRRPSSNPCWIKVFFR